MRARLEQWREALRAGGLWPASRVARAAWYCLGLALGLYLIQKVASLLRLQWEDYLGGWISFLSGLAIIFFLWLGFRWVRNRILWRLRNRLIVTYVFIGVIPALLLIAMAFVTIYLFAGQFANYVVTSGIDLRLHSIESANAAIASELALRLDRNQSAISESLEGLRKTQGDWKHRQICGWASGKSLPVCQAGKETSPFAYPSFIKGPFREIVLDRGVLYLRSATILSQRPDQLLVVSSEPLDQDLIEDIAPDLGEITLWSDVSGAPKAPNGEGGDAAGSKGGIHITFDSEPESNGVNVRTGSHTLQPLLTTGSLPPITGFFDRAITFGTPLPVVDWKDGERGGQSALVRVQTRPSVLYNRLFAASGRFATGIEAILLVIAVILAIIELLALLIGTRLTRSITSAVGQIYQATLHVDRGDFSRRIPVNSTDQLAGLAHSFNTMTASIEKLILEQKEKQRLENELAIAQEVQAQLFPREISQLESLEVHGFCRPARTVSGDYYDFVALNASRMILAVGDVSGKGISAALLMATIHSAVRAYNLETTPEFREAFVGASRGSTLMMADSLNGAGEIAPGRLLGLLNHQLFESTPAEKYATLFLGNYDGNTRRLTYSNGGHLPPLIISANGSVRRLDQGGTVVGLFDHLAYQDATVHLQPGDIFVAYSDGVTEPENDFGEFGEERLVQIVRDRWSEPLTRITEAVTAAVDDWIGDNEQPDDITLVLARAR
jgi:sigma-B regulation protein RsbU (phosphoserine phosphatase)